MKDPKTGADCYHLDRTDKDNVFCVAFRTSPMDSKGVAHILGSHIHTHIHVCESESESESESDSENTSICLHVILRVVSGCFTTKKSTMYMRQTTRADCFTCVCVCVYVCVCVCVCVCNNPEHTSLCGSRKYPVRDPFFHMIKRSLKTFMNAMTGADYTLYPFSTQNRTDFTNLLSVYLDACFFPNLTECKCV